MTREDDFVVNVMTPWLELNAFLVRPLAFDPKLSMVARQSHAIATSLKHQVDIYAHEQAEREKLDRAPVKTVQREVDSECIPARLMSDIADRSKHVLLNDPGRMSTTSACSGFEVKGREFRFLRNIVLIEHATLGEFDFMQISLDAISYWIGRRGLKIAMEINLLEADPVFQESALLFFDQQYCHRVEATRVRMFRRDEQGALHLFDPEFVKFKVRQVSS